MFLRSSFLASIGLLLSSLLLFSCGGSESPSEPPDNSQEEASQSESQGPVRGEVGETLSTGAVSVTLEFAGRLAAGPPLITRMIKRAVYQSAKSDLRTSLDLISSHMGIVQSMHDSREAMSAFREKRKPEFEGR